MLTIEELENLKNVAKAATPGPWYHCQPFMVVPKERTVHGTIPAARVDFVSTDPSPAHDCVVAPMEHEGPGMRSRDMAYIAAANPAVILSLIEEIQHKRGTRC